MKNVKRVLIVVALLSLSSLLLAAGDTDKNKVNLDLLKQLAGDWVRLDEKGNATGEVISSFRLIGGGSAVVETVFGGTDHEMVTVYYQDGDQLVLTHYCVEGNQPEMKAALASTPKQLVFECQGGANMKSDADQHMHQGKIAFLGKDRIRTEWFRYKDGQHNYTANFTLARKSE